MVEKINSTSYWHYVNGQIFAGDEILFVESVYVGGYFEAKRKGQRRIAAKVLKENVSASGNKSYSLEVVASDGIDPLKPGKRTYRKARNVLRSGTRRKVWKDEQARAALMLPKQQIKGNDGE